MMVMSSEIGVMIVIKCIFKEGDFSGFDLPKGNLIKPSLCERKKEIEISYFSFYSSIIQLS